MSVEIATSCIFELAQSDRYCMTSLPAFTSIGSMGSNGVYFGPAENDVKAKLESLEAQLAKNTEKLASVVIVNTTGAAETVDVNTALTNVTATVRELTVLTHQTFAELCTVKAEVKQLTNDVNRIAGYQEGITDMKHGSLADRLKLTLHENDTQQKAKDAKLAQNFKTLYARIEKAEAVGEEVKATLKGRFSPSLPPSPLGPYREISPELA